MQYLSLDEGIQCLIEASEQNGRNKRNLAMSGDPHYQPRDLRPYLGYDQRVGWQIIVEFFWMIALAMRGTMSSEDAKLLTRDLLRTLLFKITTTRVTALERLKTKHDILALLALMRRYLPKPLHRWLHYCATSYDIISTAYALQVQQTFRRVFYPKMQEVDEKWRGYIAELIDTLQMGRTHLQDALPMTVGCWLSVLHNRFVQIACRASDLVQEIPGKFSGAIGTRAALRALVGAREARELEDLLLLSLDLPTATLSTQVPQPEAMERFYNEITLLSAVLANLGDDARHLQASAIAEVISASSSSSTMAHKTSNPVAAENMDGMHVSVRCEFSKVIQTLGSTLQRDLRWSNVMRGFNAILVFAYQQLSTAMRMFNSFRVDEARCRQNFEIAGKLVVAELLHLSLQSAGYESSHALVNERIVPAAIQSGNNLLVEMDAYVRRSRSKKLKRAWEAVPENVWYLLARPDEYFGDAVDIAESEAGNSLPGI